ncbi:HesA/MoeB/ThiF family protein [Alteromonas halophila]|uniref:Molybdopterin-synthase adenylyltransferase MoeB n=1 Tax=Alteromonas halophila TaxID=516698 RepID=A0A918JNQ6_9ALTE|nr:molybdopterin-synthase adenylyltransferase MoeB [Alteromonas halophila]GGW89690.1 molybdopterin-synthase adenylyltransferase MoeB [Alteromonas halophila]
MNTSTLSHSQLMRYNRHIVLPQVDLDGQELIARARIAVVGVGGLGNAAAMSLTGSGVGHLTLIDNDCVEDTNLPRQLLFSQQSVGENKATAARDALRPLNPDAQFTCIDGALTGDDALSLLAGHDVVLDCTDNKATRLAVNAACVRHQTPLVSGAAIRFEGQLFVGHPVCPPCYHCLGELFSEQQLSCTEAGIFSPVAGIIGTYQAMLALQIIIGTGDIPYGKLMCFDALEHQWQSFSVPRSPACPLCTNR